MENYREKAQRVYDFIGILSKEHPKVADGFTVLSKGAGAENILSKKDKELISLAISIAIRCEGCIACHVKGALSAGASKEEIVETIGVTIAMGGGPSIVFGEKAYQALNEMMED